MEFLEKYKKKREKYLDTAWKYVEKHDTNTFKNKKFEKMIKKWSKKWLSHNMVAGLYQRVDRNLGQETSMGLRSSSRPLDWRR